MINPARLRPENRLVEKVNELERALRELKGDTTIGSGGGGGAEELSDLSDVGVTTPTNKNVLVADGDSWEARALVEADISDLGTYLTAETNDLTDAVTWANVPDENITESSVTQHEGAIDHGSIAGLTDDDHTGYALLAGRSGGQTLIGDTASGGNLTLQSTAHGTKGKLLLGSSAYDEVNNRLGIGNTSPSLETDITGQLGVKPSGGYPTSLVGGLGGRFYAVHQAGDWGFVTTRAANDAFGANLTLYHTRSSNAATRTALQSGDLLARISFMGATASNQVTQGAEIRARVTGAVSSGVLPTALDFRIASSGDAENSTPSITMLSNGNLGINTADPVSGIDLRNSMSWKRTADSTTSYTALDTDFYIGMTNAAARTVNLPAASTRTGRIYVIVDEAGTATSAPITIDPNSTELINGNATFSLNRNRGSAIIICDGTGWQVLTSPSTLGGGDMLASTYDPANVAQQLVGTTATQTLTGKTIDGDDNTLQDIPASAIKGEAWAPFTPSWTNLTVGSGTNTGRYIQIGKTVHFETFFQFGSGSAVGTGPRFTAPVAASDTGMSTFRSPVGTMIMEDNNTSNVVHGPLLWTTGGDFAPRYVSSGGLVTGTTATVPFTWATSDKIITRGTYEVA